MPASSEPPPRIPSIWILEDSKLQVETSRSALAALYDVRGFASGAAMLEALSRDPPPDLLMLDWHLPDVSGLEVCRFVRSTMNLAELPILMLTATGTSEYVLEAMAAGANDFVKKPFSEAELAARVAALVQISFLHSKLARLERSLRVEAEFRERFMGMLAHDLRQAASR